jgi:hypothetical protein
MNPVIESALNNLSSTVIYFVLSFVLSYLLISVFVYKAPWLANKSKRTKQAIVQLTTVVVFCCIAYFYSVFR